MGEGGGGRRERKGFSPSALSLFRFHLSPFPPETPDTQATVNIATNIKNFRAPEKKASKQASSLCSLLFLLKHLHFTMQFFLHVTTHKKLVLGLKFRIAKNSKISPPPYKRH